MKRISPQHLIPLSLFFVVLLLMAASPAICESAETLIAIAEDNPPFSRLRSEKPFGYDIDLWQALAERAQLSIRFLPARAGQIREMLHQGCVDAALIPHNDEDILESIPFDSFDMALFRTGNFATSRDIVLVAEKDLENLDLTLETMGKDLWPVRSRRTALQGVTETRSALLPEFQGLHMAHTMGLTDIKTSLLPKIHLSRSLVLSPMANSIEPILTEALEEIRTDGTLEMLHDHWFSIYENGHIDRTRFRRGIRVLAGVGILTATWIFSLRRQVRRRTRELRAQLRKTENASREIGRLNEELLNTQSEIAVTLGEVIENRSRETANHVRRVAGISDLLARKLGFPPEQARQIGTASALHDVGKVGIPDVILGKPGHLTAEEFYLMKTHTTIGHQILKTTGGAFFNLAARIAHEHHERWDGTGYPQGLAGDKISLEGRIVAIADVFDALSSPRIYKSAWSLNRVISELGKERGRHFDPRIVDIFLENLDHILGICQAHRDPEPNGENMGKRSEKGSTLRRAK